MHIHVGLFCHIGCHLGKKVSILPTLLASPYVDPTWTLLCRDGGVRHDTTRHRHDVVIDNPGIAKSSQGNILAS
jgi:hypothetical protein